MLIVKTKQYYQHKRRIFYATLASFVALGMVLTAGLSTHKTLAATTITVNSTADDQDDDGECTLREAIIASNTDTVSGATAGECAAGSGNDTIAFNITGPADFANGAQNGYTITPASALPDITDTTIINGYSQPGAQANTSVAPQPLNGTLLIELDGSGTSGCSGIFLNADNSEVHGLVVNNFEYDGIAIAADNLVVQGNYLGTDPTGFVANGNGFNGAANGADGSEGLQLGGLDPEDRNLISGNDTGAASPNTDSHNWVIQGNYVGVAADGITALPNAQHGGSGAFSLDNSNGHLVGGPQPSAINVIGSNLGHGIAPDNSDDITIQGNYIGVAYDGETVLGNTDAGYGSCLALSNSVNVEFMDNICAGWKQQGAAINSGNSNVNVHNNVLHNNSVNVAIGGSSSDISITRNTLHSSTGRANLSIFGLSSVTGSADGVTIQSNKIGFLPNGDVAPEDDCAGISINGDPVNVLVGGATQSEANIINGQAGGGVVNSAFTVEAFAVTFTPEKVSILGNSIYNTSVDSLSSSGLGIELMELVDQSIPPDGNPESLISAGPTVNDDSDADTGPNGYINFPVLNAVTQDGAQATINYSLDAADSPTDQYRVEFFANDSADTSGYGEGQTFLGAITSSNGDNQTTSFTLPSGTDLTGKSISATTTAIDATTNSGFGATSEFAADIAAMVVSVNETTLASTGDSQDKVLIVTGVALVAITCVVISAVAARHKRMY